MRCVFVTDVHQAFRKIDRLLDKTEADLYLIAGDLMSRSFFQYQAAWRFMELQQILKGHKNPDRPEETLDRLAMRLLENDQPDTLHSVAGEYLALCRKAEIYLQNSYKRLEEILFNHPDKTIYLIPGNYDLDLSRTALRNYDLHLNWIDSNGWRVAGYGGANLDTPGIPDHLQVHYGEKRHGAGFVSEASQLFKKIRPDILVLHQPAYGYLDEVSRYGNTGSHGIRDYLDTHQIKLVLSGHHHENFGAIISGGTVFMNPSNFGSTIEITRTRPGGYFFDLLLRDDGLEVATLRHLAKNRLSDIVDYRPSSTGIEALVLDEKKYVRLGGTLPKTRHISAIRHFQRVKSFFLGYQTPETQKLINEMRKIYRNIQREGMEVAFDLLGSLSFGMAQKDSDMDLVVYMRSKDCVLDEEDTCGVPRPLEAVFKALEKSNLEVEVCDSLDLDRIKEAIEKNDTEDGQLQRFVFYRLVCRPINLRLIKSVENLLMQNEALRREMEEGLEEYLDILVASVRHIRSFDKYKSRLLERGIKITPDVEEALRNYLRGSK